MLLAVEQPRLRRSAGNLGQTHPGRLRVQLALRQRRRRHDPVGAEACGLFCAVTVGQAARSCCGRQCHHSGAVHPQNRAEVHQAWVVLVYANRSTESVMFASTLADLLERYPTRLEVIHWFESDWRVPSR